jgi:hypothetical protein
MNNRLVKLGLTYLLSTLVSTYVYAEYSINNALQKFRVNSKAFMQSQESVQKYELKYEVITREESTGQVLEQRLVSETPIRIGRDSQFSMEDIQNNQFIDQKNAWHEGLGLDSQAAMEAREKTGRAEFDRKVDNPESLLEGGLHLKTLEQMDKKYQTASLAQSPWSGDYWPIYMGGIAKRYNDRKFQAIASESDGDWSQLTNYILDGASSSLDELSPAEKYDLLIGDTQGERKNLDGSGWGLTKAMLREGRGYYLKDHTVPKWMGHCHGWAPAAYMERRPRHKVSVMAADGQTKLTFYPSDIKALASLMWAQARTKNHFVGTRCNVKNPETDANGRILDETCFDTNPGTWHLAVVNQIGYYKKGFVLDATYDFEVWNQPAYGYEYQYFNPLTGQEVDHLKAAMIPTSVQITGKDGQLHATFEGDQFAEYRSEKAKYIVGIAMKFIYIAETAPSTFAHDLQDFDRKVAVHYLYDLELDSSHQIIGGEWYHVQHPDFLWSPAEGAKALSQGDEQLNVQRDRSHWRIRHQRPVPQAWREAAAQSSSPQGQPLARIVKELIQKSNQINFWFFGERHWNRSDTGNQERY